MCRRPGSAILLIAAAALAGPAAAQSSIGSAAAIQNKVTGTTTGGAPVRMSQGDRVYQNQVIETGSSSKAVLNFIDKTRFSVGANSRAILDTFVYNPSSRRGKIVLKTTKGAFRFVTGLGRKRDYEINTPTASIGIRGTDFHWYTMTTGTTAIALSHGTLIVCNRAKTECRTMSKPGRVVFALISGRISKEMGWGQQYMQTISFSRAFPFVRDKTPYQGAEDHGGSQNGGPAPGGEPDHGGPASGGDGPAEVD